MTKAKTKNLGFLVMVPAIIIGVMVLSGCIGEESENTEIEIDTTKAQHDEKYEEKETERITKTKPSILMVIASEDFRDEELFEPKQIFEEKGANVTIASTSIEKAKGMLGKTVKPDITISDANIDNYDAIVIVGGIGSKKYLWENEDLIVMVKEAYNKDKVVGAICMSPVVLAKASILDGKKATVSPDQESINELKNNGAVYVDENVVVSGNVITADGPKSADEFGLNVWEVLVQI